MADWFKFYENDLDETRFQYAIHQLVEVCPVWVGILSECCRHKSDTIRWGNNEIELFGFSQRLNVSVPKVNEAIKLLVDIDYISRGENTLKVLKWSYKQSDYCQRIKRATPNSVRTVSEQCSLRGEERRVDKSTSTITASLSECEAIYQWYPKKVGRGAALKAIKNAMKDASVEMLTAAVKAMAEAWKDQESKQYCPNASTWFNQKRYTDPFESYRPQIHRNGNGLSGIDKSILQKEKDLIVSRLATLRSQYDGHQSWSEKDKLEAGKLKPRLSQINGQLGCLL